jgi:hypothetical protein
MTAAFHEARQRDQHRGGDGADGAARNLAIAQSGVKTAGQQESRSCGDDGGIRPPLQRPEEEQRPNQQTPADPDERKEEERRREPQPHRPVNEQRVHHSGFSYYCALDADGAVVGEGRVATTAGAIEPLFKTSRKRIAIEAGTHSPWMSRLLARLGHEVIVSNSRKLRLIYENQHKSDRVDAEYLARVARLDPKLLGAIEHRSELGQCHLSLIRARDTLVRIAVLAASVISLVSPRLRCRPTQ